MKITRDEVLHVATLARLNLAEVEIDRLAGELSSILQYVEQLGELDLEGVEPMAHVHEAGTPLREDRVLPSLGQAAALANAPEADQGCFRVPKVIDG